MCPHSEGLKGLTPPQPLQLRRGCFKQGWENPFHAKGYPGTCLESKAHPKSAYAKVLGSIRKHVPSIEEEANFFSEPEVQASTGLAKPQAAGIELVSAAAEQIRREMDAIDRKTDHEIPRGVIHKTVARVFCVSVCAQANVPMEKVIPTQPEPQASIVFHAFVRDVINSLLADREGAEEIERKFIGMEECGGIALA